jgi:hypothetical protein
MDMHKTTRFLTTGLTLIAMCACGGSTTPPIAGSIEFGNGEGSTGNGGGATGGGGGGSNGGVSTGGGVTTSQWCDTANAEPGFTAVALACNQDTPSGLVVHNGIVYWTDYDTAYSGDLPSRADSALVSTASRVPSAGTPCAPSDHRFGRTSRTGTNRIRRAPSLRTAVSVFVDAVLLSRGARVRRDDVEREPRDCALDRERSNGLRVRGRDGRAGPNGARRPRQCALRVLFLGDDEWVNIGSLGLRIPTLLRLYKQ